MFHYDSERWIPPATEGRYRKGVDHLEDYLSAWPTRPSRTPSSMHAPTTWPTGWPSWKNAWAPCPSGFPPAPGQLRVNTDLSGDAEARQSTGTPDQMMVKTPWLEIDDVFYETRGTPGR